MKKIKTVVELAAFIVTVPLLVMAEFNYPVAYCRPQNHLPVTTAAPDRQRTIAARPDQPLPALLNSKFIIINY